MNQRFAAAKIIYQVIHEGRSLSDCLPEMLTHFKDARDQAFVQAICYGVCRWYFRLDAFANALLKSPLKEQDQDIHILILIGLYQLTEMRVPPHAAVAETVAATRDFKKIWAKGLVNAILRNYQRRAEELNEKLKTNLTAFYSHPKWMIENLKKSWPTEWKEILIANNQHPPFALRVNQKHHSRAEYLDKISKKDITANLIPETESGIVFAEPRDVKNIPGFLEGEISVQDGAAQLAAELLALTPQLRVLDACAAPGGKTAHILELQTDLELIAVDHDALRVRAIEENLQRLKLSATCLCADAADIKDEKLFDRILLDAPCSATGVIRRHPDIKLLRRESDILKLAAEQKRLLNALWNLLKPNGLLVYATCSIFPEENVLQLQSFLETHSDAKEEKITATWGKTCAVGRQILPGMHGMDGFYYAILRKSF